MQMDAEMATEYEPEKPISFPLFEKMKLKDLEDSLILSTSREEKAFWRTLINLKLQLWQERTVGEILL